MTDKELFEIVQDQLDKAKANTSNHFAWFPIYHNGKIICEAFQDFHTKNGRIRVRKPYERVKAGKTDEGKQIYLYRVYRFSKKIELVYECRIKDL